MTQWKVSTRSGTPTPVNTEKHPYTKERLETDKMSDNQKEFVREYNSMRAMLINNGLMHTK